MDNLLKLQQLGANISDIEAELNEDRIFKNDIDLDGQPQQFDNGDENTNIDYNLYKSIFGKNKKLSRYIDSNFNVYADEEPPEGHEWKTLENGEHVLINSSTGEIVSGIGGKKIKKGLDNSENKNILNNGKNKKQGDNDGRKQQKQQQSTDKEKRERKEKQERAINRIRKWMDGGGYNGDVSVINKRRGDNSAQNGVVEYSIEPKPEIKAIFEEGGMPTPSFNQLKKNDNKAIDTFKNAIAKAKQSLGDYGASVELKDDYTDINLYLSEDGDSGFAIKPNGDIVSVFSNNNAEGGRSHYMLEMATAEGGRQLDCFDIYLTKIYEAHGFKPVAKMKWDDEYIPDGWNKENFKDYNNGEPDVVFMVYDPENNIKKEKEIPYIYDYDDGEKSQHIYKWRSPAEREAIYNNMIERFNNAKTTDELKRVVFDRDKPLEEFERQADDLNSLNKEQAESIKEQYSKRYMELLKAEDPQAYAEALKEEKKKAKSNNTKITITNKSEETKSDAKIDSSENLSLYDSLLILADAKKKFDESKIKRDADGKFAKKNSAGNKSKDEPKDNDNKDTDNGTDYKSNTVKTVDEYSKDIIQKYNNIKNNDKTFNCFKTYIEENKERISKEQSEKIHNIMTDFLKDISNDKELQNKIKDFTDEELMTFAIYKKTMENHKVFIDVSINNSRINNGKGAKSESSLRLISDGEILKNIASFSNCDPNDDGFTEKGIASLKKILPLCQTFDKLYRGDKWSYEYIKKLKIGDSFKQDIKDDIDIINTSKSEQVSIEYAERDYGEEGLIPVYHTFNNIKGFDNSYFSFFIDDEEVFIDKSEFILSSIEEMEFGYKLIWHRKK